MSILPTIHTLLLASIPVGDEISDPSPFVHADTHAIFRTKCLPALIKSLTGRSGTSTSNGLSLNDSDTAHKIILLFVQYATQLMNYAAAMVPSSPNPVLDNESFLPWLIYSLDRTASLNLYTDFGFVSPNDHGSLSHSSLSPPPCYNLAPPEYPILLPQDPIVPVDCISQSIKSDEPFHNTWAHNGYNQGTAYNYNYSPSTDTSPFNVSYFCLRAVNTLLNLNGLRSIFLLLKRKAPEDAISPTLARVLIEVALAALEHVNDDTKFILAADLNEAIFSYFAAFAAADLRKPSDRGNVAEALKAYEESGLLAYVSEDPQNPHPVSAR